MKDTPKEVQFYSIDNIDILKEDLGVFRYAGAEDTCLKLKGAWRLPTAEELHLIYNHSDNLGNFKTKYYLGVGYVPEDSLKIVYRLNMMNGDIDFLQTNEEINSIYGFARLEITYKILEIPFKKERVWPSLFCFGF